MRSAENKTPRFSSLPFKLAAAGRFIISGAGMRGYMHSL